MSGVVVGQAYVLKNRTLVVDCEHLQSADILEFVDRINYVAQGLGATRIVLEPICKVCEELLSHGFQQSFDRMDVYRILQEPRHCIITEYANGTLLDSEVRKEVEFMISLKGLFFYSSKSIYVAQDSDTNTTCTVALVVPGHSIWTIVVLNSFMEDFGKSVFMYILRRAYENGIAEVCILLDKFAPIYLAWGVLADTETPQRICFDVTATLEAAERYERRHEWLRAVTYAERDRAALPKVHAPTKKTLQNKQVN